MSTEITTYSKGGSITLFGWEISIRKVDEKGGAELLKQEAGR